MPHDRRFTDRSTPLVDFQSFLEWPRGIARLGVVLCVAVEVFFGLVYFARAIGRLGDDAERNAALNFDDREFAGGNSLVVDERALFPPVAAA